MIKKIVGCTFFLAFIIAVFLYLGGFRFPIHVSKDFLIFMTNVERRTDEVAFQIPAIPQIPDMGNDFIDALAGIVNMMSALVNLLTFMINYTITFVTALVILVQEVGNLLGGSFPPIISNTSSIPLSSYFTVSQVSLTNWSY